MNGNAHGILEAQHGSCVRRGNLSHAVPDYRVGLDAPGAKTLDQRRLNRKDGWLGAVRLGEPGLQLVCMELGHQRPARFLANQGIASFQGLAENRIFVEQLLSHPGPLRALPREDKGNAWGRKGRRTNDRFFREQT